MNAPLMAVVRLEEGKITLIFNDLNPAPSLFVRDVGTGDYFFEFPAGFSSSRTGYTLFDWLLDIFRDVIGKPL